jgi:hypothetical protein
MKDDDISLTLRPGKHPQAVEIRLRQAMKILLRAFNLKCVDYRVSMGSPAEMSAPVQQRNAIGRPDVPKPVGENGRRKKRVVA